MSGAFDRILRDGDLAGVFDALEAMPGADLTSFLLEVMRARAGQIDAAGVVRRHATSRFTSASEIPLSAMRVAEDGLLTGLARAFEGLAAFGGVVLAPVAPFGVHGALGSVDQNNVVSAVRSLEVAADPTVGLALEAAAKRSSLLETDDRSDHMVRLAALQRVTRAQHFAGPASFAHFTILGLVTAGRDTGSLRFERAGIVEHVLAQARALEACGADGVEVTVSDLDGRLGDLVDLLGEAGVTDVVATERRSTYYTHAAFTVSVRFGDRVFEVGDGGLVDWSQRLLGNRRERLMTSGIGVDRVALGMTDGGPAP